MKLIRIPFLLLFLIPLLLIPAVDGQLNLTPIALWSFEENSTPGTFIDVTPSTHNGIFIADAKFSTSSKVTNVTGNNSATFDGTGDRGDVTTGLSDFVFGDGSDDQPFSVGGWVFMNDATGFRIITKRASDSQIEWGLFSTATDVFNFGVMDDDNAIRQARLTASVTALENEWIFVVGTYDGGESSGGINIYIDGVISDIANDNDGSYVAMADSGSNVTLAAVNTVSVANGFLDEIFVIGIELSEVQVNEIMNFGWGFDRVPPSIIDISVNDTFISCTESIRYSANVTDDVNVSNVTFGIDDSEGKNIVSASLLIGDIFFFDKQYNLTTSGISEMYNFTNVTATDTSGRINTTFSTATFNYSCVAQDISPPVITVTILNNSVLDRRNVNLTVNFTVTDNVGIRNITYFIFNTTDELERKDVFINITNTTSFTFNDTIDISDFGTGFYFINRIAFDTSNNTAQLLHGFSVIDFGTEITLDFPTNNSVIEFFDEPSSTFQIDFKYTVATDVTCDLFLNDTFEISQAATTGQNTFSILGFDINQTVKFNVACAFIPTPLNSSFHIFSVEIEEVVSVLNPGVCPNDTLENVLIFWLFVGISLTLIIVALQMKIGFIGFFGALMLLVLSWMMAGCFALFAFMTAALAFVLLIWFVIGPLGFRNTTFT